MGLLPKPSIYTIDVWIHDTAQKLVYVKVWGEPGGYFWPFGRAWMYAQFKEGDGDWQDSSKILITKVIGGFTEQVFMFYASTTDITVYVRGAVDYETPLGIWEGTDYGSTLSVYIPPEATDPQVATGRVRHIENDTVRMTAHGDPGSYGPVDLYMQYREVGESEWIETGKTPITEKDDASWDISVTPDIVYEARAALDYNGSTIYGVTRRTDEPIPDDLACETQPSGSGTAEDPYIITDICELQWMRNDLDAYYELGNDIDASDTHFWNWNPYKDKFEGFSPVGTDESPFTGNFDGKGYTISGLHIYMDAVGTTGMFGTVKAYHPGGLAITDVVFENASVISTSNYTGVLIGYIDLPDDYDDIEEISHIRVYDGCVEGIARTGGIVGYIQSRVDMSDCSFQGTIDGTSNVGGLVGMLMSPPGSPSTPWGTYYGLSANVDITAVESNGTYVGGLFGKFGANAELDESYSRGSILAYSMAGGLIGSTYNGVSSYTSIGDCYSRANVRITRDSSSAWAAGLIAQIDSGRNHTVDNCYSTGKIEVSGSARKRGLVGSGGNDTLVTDSFWDTETSECPTSNGGTGKTTAQMKTQSTFTDAGWDFETIWAISSAINDGYPYLQAIPYPPTVTTLSATDVDLDSAVLNGRIDEDGNDACEYRFRFREQSTEYYEETLFANSKVAGNTFSELITGLKQSTTYEFAAQARNSGGYSAWGDTLTFKTTSTEYLPSDAMARVSSIRRVYRPGLYRMEVGLGDLGLDVDMSEVGISRVPDNISEPEVPAMTVEETLRDIADYLRESAPSNLPWWMTTTNPPESWIWEIMYGSASQIQAPTPGTAPTVPSAWATKTTASDPSLVHQLKYIEQLDRKFIVTYRRSAGAVGRKVIIAKNAEEAKSIARSQGLYVIGVKYG